MEITMTLTVTAEQAAAVAEMLAGKKPQSIQDLQQTTPPAFNITLTGNTPQVQQNAPIPQTIPHSVPTTATPTVSNPTAQPIQTIPTQQAPPVQQSIPTQVQTYTVQDLALACRPLMEAGKQLELQALLTEFGASAGINSIPENLRSDFAARLRAMGGQI